MALVSRTHRDPHYYNNNAPDVYPDQYFTLLYEDMQIDSVEYDVDLGTITQSTPIILASEVLTNNVSSVQQTTVTVNQTTTHTSSFNFTFGFKINGDVQFKGTSNYYS